MSFKELNNKIEELGTLNAQFRKLTDLRLEEMERRGSVDPLTTKQINDFNAALDSKNSEIEQLKACMNRPQLEGIKSYSANDGRYQQAFCSYLRSGSLSDLEGLHHKSANASERDGGYLLTSRMHEVINQSYDHDSVMRRIANVTTVSGDALELVEDMTPEIAGWSESIDTILHNSKHSQLVSKKIIPVHELYAQPKATQKMLDDPRIDVEKWLSNRLASVFNTEENHAFIHGSGIGKPRGILSYPNGMGAGEIERIAVQEEGKIKAEDLIKLFFSIKPEYANNAKFLLSRDALHQIRLLRNEQGQYLWQPGLSEGTPANILGAEVVVCNDMHSATAKSIPIAFGDFYQGYQIVDRHGVRVLRDPYTEKPFVKFYSTKRLGGDVIDSNAIKLLQL